MAYADLEASDSYVSKHSGAGVAVALYDENDVAAPLLGAASNVNATDDFEGIGIEEAGNDGVDEWVLGRHSGSGTIQAFFTPKWNDALPTRQNFIGRRFILIEKIAATRPSAGEILNAYVGVIITRVGSSHGARGAKTFDIAINYERRYSGSEWAAKAAA